MNPTQPQVTMNLRMPNQLKASNSDAVAMEKSRATIFGWSFEDLSVIVMSIAGDDIGVGKGLRDF